MRQFISFLLTLSILSHSLNSAVILIGYSLNKDYITKTYCVNKDKPNMHCNGKCHMMKEIKDQEKKESSPLSLLKDKMENIFYLTEEFNFQFANKIERSSNITYNPKELNEFSTPPFQPPQA